MKQVVDIFQADSRVIAYSVSDAANGPHGSLTDYHGHLTYVDGSRHLTQNFRTNFEYLCLGMYRATGQAYLNAIKPYAHA